MIIWCCSWCGHILDGQQDHCGRAPFAIHTIPPTWVRWDVAYGCLPNGLIKLTTPVIVSTPDESGLETVGAFRAQEALNLYIEHPSVWPTVQAAERATRCPEEVFYTHYGNGVEQ